MRLAALALAASLVGCSDPELDRLARTRATVCACKSVDCANAALAQLPAANATSNHRTQAHARAMLDCLAKLQAAAPEASDPAAAAPAAAP